MNLDIIYHDMEGKERNILEMVKLYPEWAANIIQMKKAIISDDMVQNLKKMAERDCADDNDDFNALDYSGGNYDDAYSMGSEDGETHMARLVLLELTD